MNRASEIAQLEHELENLYANTAPTSTTPTTTWTFDARANLRKKA
jgi:hypothetical protein